MNTFKIFVLVISIMAIYAKAQSVDYTRAPNSYIFDPYQNDYDGFYIPVKKAYAMWQDENGYIYDADPISGTLSASIYWEDVSGLIISDPDSSENSYNLPISGTGENAKIKVLIDKSKGEGNAVIAFKVNGEIKWSWHVWVTDDPTDGAEYSQGFETDLEGVKFSVKYMDRNLGATNPSFLGYDWHKSNGLMYEWGRKDPFPPLEYKDKSFYKISGEAGTIVHRSALNKHADDVVLPVVYRPYDDISNNLKYSVNNPLQYIINRVYSYPNGNPADNGEDTWTYNSSSERWVYDVKATWFSKAEYESENNAWDLWGDNYRGGKSNASSSNPAINTDSKSYELKSPYDPCPNGWRVPSNYGRLTTNNNHSPWGRKNSGGNDDANLLGVILPNTENSALTGIKAYPGLGFDFSGVTDRDLGWMPVTGNFENYPNSVSPVVNNLGSVVYQDEASDGALWSATYAEGGARHFKLIAATTIDSNNVGDHVISINSTTPSKDGNAVRCMQDPNISFLADFQIENIPSQNDVSDYISWTKEPNSFLVEGNITSQVLEIPVRKAYAMHKLYLSDDKNLPQGSKRTPSVYWTTNTDLIQKIELNGSGENAHILVTIKGNQYGNAVIALHIGNNGAFGVTNPDPVIWSWHIWVPETMPEEITYTTEIPITTNDQIVDATRNGAPPLVTTFMDRNLGALQAMPSQFAHSTQELRAQLTKSGGLHYQWGRKDPIPTFTNPGLYDNTVGAQSTYVIFRQNSLGANNTLNSSNFTQINKNNYLSGYTRSYSTYANGINNSSPKHLKVKNGINYSVKNPLTFMYHSEVLGLNYTFEGNKPIAEKVVKIKDWISDENGLFQDRWGHGTEKSPYDPCPAGWRVPDTSYSSLHDQFIMKGTSPWYYSKSQVASGGGVKYGIHQRHYKSIQSSSSTSVDKYPGINHKASFPTANHHGWVFNNPLYSIGNIPSTGIRGMLGGNNFENPYGYYPTENYKALTGLWTASPGDFLSGYAIALEIGGFHVSNSLLGRMYTGVGHYPQAAMSVRCAKDEPRYIGFIPQEENSNNEFYDEQNEEIETEAEKLLYPNPVKDVLYISSKEEVDFVIYNLNGKIVANGKFKDSKANISGLSSGIYLIKLIYPFPENNNVITKIIKQ